MSAPSSAHRSLAWAVPSRMALLVVAAGVVGGVVGAAYLAALEMVTHVLGPERWPALAHLVVLVGVGAVVAVIVRLLGETRNVELLVDDIHVLGGSNDVRSLRSLIPVSLLCIGSGGTLGPEAPLIQATGALGGRIATVLGLDRRQLRILTITGMAAGFTTLFGAPLGAAVFALEIPHRRGLEHADALIPAAVGALTGYGAYVLISGNGLEPIFALPAAPALQTIDLAWAVAAGVASSVVALLFAAGVRISRRAVDPLPRWLRPACGGLALGLLALWSPEALTNGELMLRETSTSDLAIGALLVAAAAKMLGAIVSVAGEWRGGFIIPLFFIGAALGTAAHVAVPETNQWVLVTAMMVGCNVGVTKTPIGSALVVTEMAGARLLPTVLIASLVALALTSPLRVIESQRQRHEAIER